MSDKTFYFILKVKLSKLEVWVEHISKNVQLTFYNQLSPKYYILEYVQMPVRLSQVLCKVSRLLPALPHTTLCGCGYPYRTPHYNLTKGTIAYRKDLPHIPHFFLPIPHMILVLSPWKNKFFSSIMSVDII